MFIVVLWGHVYKKVNGRTTKQEMVERTNDSMNEAKNETLRCPVDD